MCHVFDDSVYCICELAGIIKRLEMTVVLSIFAAIQGVLNVLANRSVNIAASGLVVAKRSIFCIDIIVIKCKLTGTQRTSVTNILVNAIQL